MSTRNKKGNKKKRNLNRNRGNGRRPFGTERNSMILPLTHRTVSTSFRNISPTEIDVTARFGRRFVNSGAAPAVTKRFNTNSIWRPDPASFSEPSAGLTEWQTLYSLYRVIGYHYEVYACNNEAFPVVVYVTNTNEDPSVSETSADAMTDLSQIKVLSAKTGQDRALISHGYKIATVVGSDDIETDDNYRGLLSSGSEASPGDVTWLGVGAESIGGANITLGVSFFLRLRQVVRLYDRQFTSQGATFKKSVVSDPSLKPPAATNLNPVTRVNRRGQTHIYV